MFRPPTPKPQLDFFDLKSSWSLGVVVGGGGLVPDTPPTTTPKLQLDFFDLKSSWSLGVVVGGGVWCQTPPPTTTPKLQLDFLDLKSSWSLGVVVGGGSDARHPPPPPPQTFTKIWSFASNDIMCHISASNRIWAFKFFVGVGGVGGDPHACVTDMRGCKQEGNKGISNLCLFMLSHEMWRHTLVILSNVECARIGWSDVQTPHPHHHP